MLIHPSTNSFLIVFVTVHKLTPDGAATHRRSHSLRIQFHRFNPPQFWLAVSRCLPCAGTTRRVAAQRELLCWKQQADPEPWPWGRKRMRLFLEKTEVLCRAAEAPHEIPKPSGLCGLLKFRWKEIFRYHLLHSITCGRAIVGTGPTCLLRLDYLPHPWRWSLGVWLSCFSALT